MITGQQKVSLTLSYGLFGCYTSNALHGLNFHFPSHSFRVTDLSYEHQMNKGSHDKTPKDLLPGLSSFLQHKLLALWEMHTLGVKGLTQLASAQLHPGGIQVLRYSIEA